MKYKRINAAIHNFGHSFVSHMNFVDDEFITDLLRSVLRDLPDQKLVIRFPEGTIRPRGDYPSPLLKSVGYWAAAFPDQLRGEGIEPDALRETCLVLSLGPSLRCEARTVDDRGKPHSVSIVPA